MADHRRRTLHRLIRQTVEQQVAVEFFQFVRLLERYLCAPDSKSAEPGRHAVGQAKLDASPAIRFRADTANRARTASALPQQAVPELNADSPVEVWTSFLNLIGTTGVLPQDYTTLVLERVRAGDNALRDYLDVFHHRLTELAYQVWEKSRPDIAWERSQLERQSSRDGGEAPADDRFTAVLRCLVGDNQPVRCDDARLYYSAFFSNIRRPALSLQSMLSERFQVPATVLQFYPRSVRLRDEDCWRLPTRSDQKSAMTRLGHGLIAGRKLPIVQTRFLIRLGPLDYHAFRNFLPNGSSYLPLKDLVRSYVGPEFEFDVQLQLDARQSPEMRPGVRGPEMRLGWNTWLTGSRDSTAEKQVSFMVRD